MNFYETNWCYKNNTALIEESGNKISYRELFAIADCTCNELEPHKLAFLFCKNDMPSIAVYLGMLRKHIVPILLNQKLSLELIENLIACYQPQILFLPQDDVAFDVSNYNKIRTFHGYVFYQHKKAADYKLHPDLALLLTTSGSTGSPKLVRQSYKNLSSNTAAIVEYLGIDAESRLITTLPMYYTYGLSMLQTHLAAGATVILSEAVIVEKRFWQLLKEYQATTFGGVPYTYEMLKKLRFERMELPDLKVITQAGGRLSPELVSDFADICDKKNIEFFVMYGAAEATARMSYLPPTLAREKSGSIGIAIPHGEFFLEDEAGKVILTAETIGELVYRGDNVMMGYAENYHDLLRDDENQGILHTGDMAKFDDMGLFYIVGRKRRFLKIYGNRVNLVEAEEILHQAGYDCVCTGKDDQMNIYLTNPQGKEDVCVYISRKLGLHQSAFFAYFIEIIPRNESGKILYGELENARKGGEGDI